MRHLLKMALIAALLVPAAPGRAQDDPMVFQRWNIFDINKVRTMFNNTGLLCDGNQQNFRLARPPAFEYPNGSGKNYGTSVGLVVGAPVDQPAGAVGSYPPAGYDYFCDATLDEGSAAYWDEEHFAPYPGFAGSGAAMSDDPESWPAQWPTELPDSGVPLLVGSEGWPGAGPNGERIADQESFSVAYAWGGTDIGPIENKNWLKTQITVRGLAWKGSLYDDFIVWIYTIRNIGTDTIHDMRIGIHSDFGCLPEFLGPNYDADRAYYDPDLQLAYTWDDNSFEIMPDGRTLGADDLAWSGNIVLRVPGDNAKVATYDAFHFWAQATTPRGNGARSDWYFRYNVINENDPHDSNGDGIDDDFDGDGIPDAENGGIGYYVASGADAVQTLGSASFDLAPGAVDTVIFATVFGDNQKDLFANAKRAKNLYESNWQVVTAPPAPVVEAVPGDVKVTLFWDTVAEKDPEFEGYKIYRSADGGVTWGSESFTDFEGSIHFVPLEQFDLENNIKGFYKTLPEYAWFFLGSDKWTQLRRTVTEEDGLHYFDVGDTVNVLVDRDIINGLAYQYYVAAYDSGNGIVGPLENTPATDPSQVNNTVLVVPHAAPAGESLDEIRVVPNPYVIANTWEQGKERQLQFTHMPTEATIRILNSAGELVRVLEHRGAGIAPSIATWNMLNQHNQLVAPGLYFYHLTSPQGEASGKFVIMY